MPSRHRLPLAKNSIMKFCLCLVHLIHLLKDNRRLATWKIEMRYEDISSVVYGQTSDTMKPFEADHFWIGFWPDVMIRFRSDPDSCS